MSKRSFPRRVARRLLEACGLRAPDTSQDTDYAAWVSRVEPDASAQRRLAGSFRTGPKISVVMPVYEPRIEHLRAAIASVQSQAYPHWQLCICDDGSRDAAVLECLDAVAASDPRIRVHRRSANGGIGLASADAAALADGEFLAMLDQDDVLAPWALLFVAKALEDRPDAELLYSDEDKLDDRGARFAPHFKPSFDPELLGAINYMGHLLIISRRLFDSVGGFRAGFDGAQDYDLVLRCVSATTCERVVHISAVLYHWRAHAGSTARRTGEKAYAHRAGIGALSQQYVDDDCVDVADGPLPTTYRVIHRLRPPLPRVTVMIPTRDGGAHLEKCLGSVLDRSSYREVDVIVIDNQSSDTRTLELLDRFAQRSDVRVLRYDKPFNYSAINNFGAAQARGDVLVLLNDDIVVRSVDWLEVMLGALLRPGVGVVGAKLYYPNGTVQHGGVILGIGGVAGHAHKYFARRHPGYFGRLVLPHTVSAVTGACLMVRRTTYQSLAGLDEENLPVAFNDVDFCLRVRESGLRCVWTPYAEMTHHESLSRGAEDTSSKRKRFDREAAYMKRRWGRLLQDDPHYSPYLTRRREDFSLRDDPPTYLSRLREMAR